MYLHDVGTQEIAGASHQAVDLDDIYQSRFRQGLCHSVIMWLC